MSPDATVRDLLCALDFERGAVAVAVNGVFVPRSQHATHVLRDGDALELLAPMQGG
ncbi:MAG: sulfur carrier protein ThiS [Myxococcota bacterium]